MSLVEAPVSIKSGLQEALHFLQAQVETHPTGILRCEWPISPLSLSSFAQTQTLFPNFYWQGRSSTLESLALSSAFAIKLPNSADLVEEGQVLRRLLDQAQVFEKSDGNAWQDGSNDDLRVWGGVQFGQAESQSPEWVDFSASHFFIPHIELYRLGDSYRLACQVLNAGTGTALNALEAAIEQLKDTETDTADSFPRMLKQRHVPDKPAWDALFKVVQTQFNQQSFQKIVLARKAEFTLSDNLSPYQILEKPSCQNCKLFKFNFSPVAGKSFFGLSPELLFTSKDGHIRSEAVAGTRPRHADPEQDALLASELMHSAKDRVEHQFVSDQIYRLFQNWCYSVEKDQRISVVKTPKVQHLYQRFIGQLKSTVSEVDVLSGLHPTPAVCGLPKSLLRSYIAQLEPFERGMYSGAVGYFGAKQSTFAVGIRSGLIDGNTLHLYAGVGLVADSNCDQEWDEMSDKLRLFSELFNG